MSTNPAGDHLRDYLIGVEDKVEMINYLDLALAAERSAGATPLDVEALRRAMYSLNMYGSAFALAEAYAEAEAARLAEGSDR